MRLDYVNAARAGMFANFRLKYVVISMAVLGSRAVTDAIFPLAQFHTFDFAPVISATR